MKFAKNLSIDDKGVMEIGGCSVEKLREDYGTPLYVIDEEHVRDVIREYRDSFRDEEIETVVAYASKAFINIAMCKLVHEEGISLDVVSGGELFTALRSGMDHERIIMHGNNKTIEELEMAIENRVGRIVVDNEEEIDLIHEICERKGRTANILIRVNPGIEAHTHEYIQTSKHDSKFGISIYSRGLCDIIRRTGTYGNINLLGFHCHIGSQIFEGEFFQKASKVMIEFISRVKDECGFTTRELNLGGGFGVYYSNGDKPFKVRECLKDMLNTVKDECVRFKIPYPRLIIEPGRAIVASAGVTLYSVGGVKKTYGGKEYAFIDGGMTDNLRTALYGAVYHGYVANKMNHENDTVYTVAGKCCESGDVIIKDIELPKCERGDILAVMCTGAYNYSMASNYNRLMKPAVVFVQNGKSSLKVKRETMDDLIRNDIF